MFDPSKLDDPLALTTEWTPLAPGGSNFTTHALHEHPQGLEYRKNLAMMLFGGAFLTVGLVTTPLAFVVALWLFALGVPFLIVGLYLTWPTKVLFDRASRSVRVRGRVIPFTSIVAIQMITERVDGSDGPDYDSHELNLVLRDGSRVNVVDHAGKEVLREDLARLRALVGCRVWDATAR